MFLFFFSTKFFFKKKDHKPEAKRYICEQHFLFLKLIKKIKKNHSGKKCTLLCRKRFDSEDERAQQAIPHCSYKDNTPSSGKSSLEPLMVPAATKSAEGIEESKISLTAGMLPPNKRFHSDGTLPSEKEQSSFSG